MLEFIDLVRLVIKSMTGDLILPILNPPWAV